MLVALFKDMGTHTLLFKQNVSFLPKVLSLYPNGYIRCTFEYLKLYPKSTTIIGYVSVSYTHLTLPTNREV